MNHKYVFVNNSNHDDENLTKNRLERLYRVYATQKYIYIKLKNVLDKKY